MKFAKLRYTGAILLAGICWGVIGLFVRSMNDAGLDSMQISFLRSLFCTLFLSVGLFIYNRKLLKIRLRDIWCFVGTGIVSVTFFNFCYFRTIAETSLSVASVLLYTAPAFVAIFSALLFHEKLTWGRIFAIALALVGCTLVTGVFTDTLSLSPMGLLTGLGAGFGYALYSIFGRYALQRGYHTLTVNFWTFFLSALSMIPLTDPGYIFEKITGGTFPWGTVILLSVVSSLLPYMLYTYGLSGIPSGQASVIASVEPVAATLVGLVAFDEELDLWNVVGICLVLSAIVVLNLNICKGKDRAQNKK